MKCQKKDVPLLGLMAALHTSASQVPSETWNLPDEGQIRYLTGLCSNRILHTIPVPSSLSNACSFPSIQAMIKKMEQEDYIIRKADEQDQRVMRLTLAKKGKDCVAYVIKTAEKLEEIVMKGK